MKRHVSIACYSFLSGISIFIISNKIENDAIEYASKDGEYYIEIEAPEDILIDLNDQLKKSRKIFKKIKK